MAKKEVNITFKTITPLWIGDAWQECKEIRPSSLIGSLRFWFEVICYFSGICKKEDFNSKNDRFEKEVNREELTKCLVKKGNTFEAKIECLLKQGIPLPSIIFGTTNWRSLIEVKSIKYLEDYCFGNKLNLPDKICINKSNYKIKENYDCPRKSNENWSVFYFTKPYFYGKFKVKFQIEEEILEPIFYPLLTFMDKYGFWGGKWNIGYGRLKVLKVKINNRTINDWKKDNFKLFDNINFSWNEKIETVKLDFNSTASEFLKSILDKSSDDMFSFSCKEDEDFRNKMKSFSKKIIILENSQGGSNDYRSIIENLLKAKVRIRNCLRHKCENQFKNCFEKRNGKEIFNGEKSVKCNGGQIECKELKLWRTFRHKLLGEQGEGSKILQFIYEEQQQLKGGFLSIAGLLNLKGEENE